MGLDVLQQLYCPVAVSAHLVGNRSGRHERRLRALFRAAVEPASLTGGHGFLTEQVLR
jgi:hypothetical protein